MSNSCMARQFAPAAKASAVRTTEWAASASRDAARPPLTPAEQTRLTRLFSQQQTYVEHPEFDEPGIENRLFGAGADRIGKAAQSFRWPTITGQPYTGERAPTLSLSEEQHLFMRLNYARRQVTRILADADGGSFSIAEARFLLDWEERARAARAALVQINLRLVLTMLKRTRLTGVDRNDLISDGNIVLLRSVELFDCSRGFKFSTYCCRAIRNSFSQAALRASRYRGRFPVKFNPNMDHGDERDMQRLEVESACVDALKEILHLNLADLSDVERQVIQKRFGFVAGPEPAKPKTLEDVGQQMDLTKERVRQIQNKALRKIRETLRVRCLAA